MTRSLQLDEPDIRVRLNENRRARRFTLRLAEPGEGAVLTLPPGVPMTEVRMFLLRHSDWLAKALARQPQVIWVGDGAILPVDGKPVQIRQIDGPRRPPIIAGDVLEIQGRSPPGPRIAVWLKERARARMVPKVQDYARQVGRSVSGVTLKDTRSRWGSCSTAGRVNLSWRLALAPVEIQDYVVAHEVAHLVEMN
ncbi:MAG: SprT family zinc-dependent metalloprotease, partial [Pseudomonadota bacterium]